MSIKKFIHWCDRAMAFSFYALIYFLPISIALSEIFTVLALVSYLLKRSAYFCRSLNEASSNGKNWSLSNKVICFFKSYKPVSNCLNWPIVFILIFSFISVLVSPYRSVSLNGFLGKILQSAFLYFNFIECMNSKKRLKIFLGIFLVSSVLICINGFYQSVSGFGFIRGNMFDGRVASSLRAANDFGAYLLVIVPILYCVSFFIGSTKQAAHRRSDSFASLYSLRVRIICLIAFMLGVICLGLTYSRGAWFGFLLSLLLMSLFGLRNRKIFASNIILIVLFVLVFYPKLIHERITTKTRILNLPEESQPFSAGARNLVGGKVNEAIPAEIRSGEINKHSGYWQWSIRENMIFLDIKENLAQNNRLYFWRRSVRIFKDYPLFGCGLNTYALVEGGYSVGVGGYPHNSFLQMAAETGLMGISAFLWMLIVLFRASFGALWRIDDQATKILLFGILTGLVAFLIHSFFDTNFYSVQLGSLLWIMMGALIALQRAEAGQQDTTSDASKPS